MELKQIGNVALEVRLIQATSRMAEGVEGDGKTQQARGQGTASELATLKRDHEVLQNQFNELQELYDTLLAEHEKQKSEKPQQAFSAWLPYIKITVLWTLTALVLFVVAERQYTSGQKVGFGFLAACGGASLFLAIPATHWIGHLVHQDYKLFQPFRGGVRFVVLQAISWTFYGITAVIVMGGVAFAEHTNGGMLASAGVIGILSQVFMVSSLLTYSNSSQSSRRARRIWRQNSGVINDDDPADELLEEERQAYHAHRKSSASDSEQSVDSEHPRRRAVVTSVIDRDMSDRMPFALEPETDKNIPSVVKEFVHMNTGLVVIGIALGLLSEHSPDIKYKPILGLLSLMCCIVAISLTHGIGGRLRHFHRGWSFAQSFRGGKEFVFLQAFGWCFFGISILAQGAFVISSAYLGKRSFKGTMYIGALAAVVSHYAIVSSLPRFDQKEDNKATDPRRYRVLESFTFWEHLSAWPIMILFCNLQFMSFVVYMVLFTIPYFMPDEWQPWLAQNTLDLIPDLNAYESNDFVHTFKLWWILMWAVAFWTFFYSALNNWGIEGWRQSISLSLAAVAAYGGVLSAFRDSPHYMMLLVICTANLVYISTTFTKRPEFNACREWDLFRRLQFLPRIVEKYFGLRVELTEEMQKFAPYLGDENAKDPRMHQVLLLFHPHGIFPVTHAVLPLSLTWRKLFPKLQVNSLSATINHIIPVMRDVIQWMGVCDVSRATVMNLIRMGRNLQIVCGGQTEMFESRSWDKKIAIVRKRRRGIFKIAIQQGLGIVPMYSFGEPQIFDNVYMPRTQAFFKRLLGFPFPFFMIGKFGLPIPCRVPVTVAIDAPVFPVKQNSNPTPEEVTEFQYRYFEKLEALFERYKHDNGHSEHELDFIDY